MVKSNNMKTIKYLFTYFFLVAFISLTSFIPNFVLAAFGDITNIYSCKTIKPPSTIPEECYPGITVDDSYILLYGSGFNPESDTVTIADVNVPIIKNGSNGGMLVLDMPNSLRAVAKNSTGQVVLLVKAMSGDFIEKSVSLLCANEACAATTSPTPIISSTPNASVTPKPSGASPSPTGSGSATPPTQPIETDLRGECQKQGLQYDNASGLCLPTNPYKASADSLAGQTTLGGLIRRVLNILLTLAGVVAVLMIILGGYQYVTSRGAEDQAKAGRKTITYAAIGLIAVLLAYMLVTVVTNFATQGVLFN